MFLILMLLVALAIIVMQVKAIKGLKVSLTEEIALKNMWYDRYCTTKNKLFDMEDDTMRVSMPVGRYVMPKSLMPLKGDIISTNSEQWADLFTKSWNFNDCDRFCSGCPVCA